ncbi:MAG: AMP-binding protein [SAR324 cluster bacterium]|nr:AMP-binding protein [SAR324 cluster bacterium]
MFEVKPDILKQILEHFADEQFLISESQDWTFSAFFEEAILFSKSLNISPQEHVALCSVNPEYLLKAMFALWLKGAVVVPLNPKYPENQKQKLLKKTRSTFLEQLELNRISSEQQPDYNTLKSINTDAWASIIFTSGSTGSPKAVVHSLTNHFYSALGANQVMSLNPGDRWMISLPLYHVGGLAIFFRTLLSGATLVVPCEKLTLAESLIDNKISHLSLVPTQLYRLLQSSDGIDSLLRLKLILLGGSAIPVTLLDQSLELGLNIKTTYGSTEMASQVATGGKNSYQILPFREVRISSEKDACPEIEVRGKTRFLGYLDESGLSQPFDKNGWFKTGDIGVLDVNPTKIKNFQPENNNVGYRKSLKDQSDIGHNLTVLGRKDNMFISGGENIHPEEIEQVMYKSGMIKEAVVVPVKDVEFGARPVVFLKYKESASETELVKLLEKQLVNFKVPELFLPWPEVPRAGFKPNRKELSQQAQAQFDLNQKDILAESNPISLDFDLWLAKQKQGWKRIAIDDERQIFKLLDKRDKNSEKYIYIRADSRKEVMEWLLADENRILHETQNGGSQLINWISIEKTTRGLINESFEIIRLLEEDLPDIELSLYDSKDRGNFKPFIFNPQKKLKKPAEKTTSFSCPSISQSYLMNEFHQGWDWEFPEAVFQSGVKLVEFKRMYLLRCLYRRSGSTKNFLGWKVQLLKDFASAEEVGNPFWELSRKEEKLLEKVLKKAGFFSKDEYLHSNTAEKERKRRFKFQKEIEKLYI